MPNSSKYVQMAALMKALAHPVRLFIIDQLKTKDCCVCELQEMIGYDMSTVSRHLAVLRNAGIINSRKHNNQVFYNLHFPCVLKIYECIVDAKRSDETD